MRRHGIFLVALAVVTTACSSGSEEAAYEVVEAEAVAESAMAGAPIVERVTSIDIAGDSANAVAEPSSTGTIPVSMPQIAYVYGYGFRVPSGEIATLAQRHVDLCEAKGPQNCRVVSLRQEGGEGDYGYGRLELAVAAGEARAFGRDLASAAEGIGGEQVDVAITGEDLSKQIVDTEARLRARTLLRDRLMDILRNRRGTVQELVQAERGVAQVNEEIDQARSWLAEMRGRVAFSKVNIEYNSGARSSGGFSRPIIDAFQGIGAVMGAVIGGLIYFVAGFLPIAILLLGIAWIWRRRSWWPLGKTRSAVAPEAEETA